MKTAKTGIWIACMESTNFNFQAMGVTKAEAIQALEKGLRQHCQQYRATKFWDASDFNTREFKQGMCYRDFEVI